VFTVAVLWEAKEESLTSDDESHRSPSPTTTVEEVEEEVQGAGW
jgi:hypothetical protein